jgi:hypothetical protein
MAVDVTKVTNRRQVHYESLQDLISDAERLSAGPVRTLGNKSFEQILRHLSLVMDVSIDGSGKPLPMPLYIRVLARLLKKKILARGLRPGIRLGADGDARVWPAGRDAATELEDLRKAVHRLGVETKRGSHPAFGKMDVDEWHVFHLRHSELHMSFVVPA